MVHLGNRGIPVKLLRVEGPLIEENRNQIIEQTSAGSYLISIDDDMTFESDAIYKLYQTATEKNLDIVCGLFSDEYGQPRIQKGGVYLKTIPTKFLEIDACGMAFTMFSPRVVESLKLEKPFTREYPYSEDLSFCRRAKEKGFKIWCNPEVTIGHLRLKSIYPK